MDGDGTLNPLDVLAIINALNNTANGEGESKSTVVASSPIGAAIGVRLGASVDDATWLAAYTQIEQEMVNLRRRRG